MGLSSLKNQSIGETMFIHIFYVNFEVFWKLILETVKDCKNISSEKCAIVSSQHCVNKHYVYMLFKFLASYYS